MGKKLDALLGKTFKTSKFKSLANLAVSRIAYLEKKHKVQSFQARSDVVQLLSVGQQEHALLRVELAIREQNMLDAYAMIENYIHILLERVMLIENNKKCPDELQEAITSLVFAASRCGELPELQKISRLFTSRFGKEFAIRAVELRNNCGVNPKIARKLSTLRPSMDSKLKALNEIASTNEIILQLAEEESAINKKKQVASKQQQHLEPIESTKLGEPEFQDFPEKLKQDDNNFSEAMRARKKYRDVGTAANEAFKLAAHAAAAARAAVELLQPQDKNSDDLSNSTHRRYVFHFDDSLISGLHINEDAASKENSHLNDGLDSDKIEANCILSSKPRSERIADNKYRSHLKGSEERLEKVEMERMQSASSFGSDGDNLGERKVPSYIPGQYELSGKERGFVKNDNETRKKQDESVLKKLYESDFDAKSSLRTNECLRSWQSEEVADREVSNINKEEFNHQPPRESLLKQPVPIEGVSRLEGSHHNDSAEQFDSRSLQVGRKPLSFRTKQMHKQ